jgi:hypothetical protein
LACGSKAVTIFLPDFCPQGKNLEEKMEKHRCERALSGDRVTCVILVMKAVGSVKA